MDKLYVRIMAGVLTRCGGKMLMQRRAPHKKLHPGLWSIPGGHMEAEELRNPSATALRELREETGIRQEELMGFGLRYVVLSPRKDELRIHFDYVAELEKEPKLVANAEGTLHWLPPEEIPGLDMSVSMRPLMKHYLRWPDDARVHVGVVADCEIDFFRPKLRRSRVFARQRVSPRDMAEGC